MKDLFEIIRSLDFERVIGDDVTAFIDSVKNQLNSSEPVQKFSDEQMFYLLRTLFHIQIYRLYSEKKSDDLDHFANKILSELGPELPQDFLISITSAFLRGIRYNGRKIIPGYAVFESMRKKDQDQNSFFDSSLNDLRRIFTDTGDASGKLIIYLTGIAGMATGSQPYTVLRKKVLAGIHDRQFRKSHVKSRWGRFINNSIETLRFIFIMEKLPYIITIFFGIIGFLLTYLFNEYQDIPVIKYHRTIKNVYLQDFRTTWYDNLFKFYRQNDATFDPGSPTDALLYILHDRQVDLSKRHHFYAHHIRFRNISFKSNLKGFDLNFKYSGDDRIIYFSISSKSLIKPWFEPDLTNPYRFIITKITMPPESSMDLVLITTSRDLPFNMTVPQNESRIILLKDNIFNRILDSRLVTILILIGLSTLIILVNLIFYAKHKKYED